MNNQRTCTMTNKWANSIADGKLHVDNWFHIMQGKKKTGVDQNMLGKNYTNQWHYRIQLGYVKMGQDLGDACIFAKHTTSFNKQYWGNPPLLF